LIPRIYYPDSLQPGSVVLLEEASSRHLLTVLRLERGEPLQIFNGQGGVYLARLQAVEKKRAVVGVGTWVAADCESPLMIHLGQAISRGERMDYTVQKSVELGVHRITPLLTDRCGVKLKGERTEHRVRHWRQVAISAVEQCGRCRIPTIENPQSFADFLAQATGLRLICSLFEDAPQPVPVFSSSVSSVTVLIGPEGGFSPPEIEQAQQAGFQALSLGPRILRTETAAVVALTLLQHRWGDLIFV
jgi:16S rRNA (uracil1498-N3)-methyltransferase